MDKVKRDEGNPINWNCVTAFKQSIQIVSLLSIKVYVRLIYTIKPVYESDFFQGMRNSKLDYSVPCIIPAIGSSIKEIITILNWVTKI